MTNRYDQFMNLFWNPILIKSLDAALAMILLKASEITRTHSTVCGNNCWLQNANLEFNHAANWSWHSVKTTAKIKSKGEKEKMSGSHVIKKQKDSLLCFLIKIRYTQTCLLLVYLSYLRQTLSRFLTLGTYNLFLLKVKWDRTLNILTK